MTIIQALLANQTGIITSGLVLYLDAGNSASYPGSGTTWFDLSGNGNNGTLLNGPTFNGSILDFDGTNQGCNIGSPTNLNNEYATHEIWVKLDNPNNGVAQQIFARRNTSAGTFTMAKTDASLGNTFRFNYRDATNIAYSLPLNTLPSTNWIHLVQTYNGTNVSAYVNGILDASLDVPAAGITGLSGPLNTGTGGPFAIDIARNNNAANFMDGKVGLALAYNRALSAAEVAQNFNAFRGRFGI